MVLQVFGCATIALGTAAAMCWGLASFLTGSGLNVTCINMMLTQRFAPEDHRREKNNRWAHLSLMLGSRG
jgi:POT family proton-dependent oligopeptide transporter